LYDQLSQTAASSGNATEEQARRMDGAFLSIGCLCDLLKRKVPALHMRFTCRRHIPLRDSALMCCGSYRLPPGKVALRIMNPVTKTSFVRNRTSLYWGRGGGVSILGYGTAQSSIKDSQPTHMAFVLLSQVCCTPVPVISMPTPIADAAEYRHPPV
jgi:hypothetical protein